MPRSGFGRISSPVLLLLFALMPIPGLTQTAPPRAIVVDGAGPWQDAQWATGVTGFTGLLTDAGYQISTVSPADLPMAPPATNVLVAIPSLESLPLACLKTVTAFLASGGTLMASGGEPFRNPLYPAAGGTWIDKNSLLQALIPEKTVLNPASASLTKYLYVPESVAQTTVTGPDGQPALDLQIQMTGAQFLLFSAPLSTPIFSAGQTATIVWTRGTPGQSMLFEWQENDGSGWVAIVPLAAQWTKQVLLPADFRYYAGGPAGRSSTTFNPAQAHLFFFGVSSGQVALPGPLEFAVSSIGVATPGFESFGAPVVETLSPGYKQYVTQLAGQNVRIPFIRGRGLTATADPDGRYRAIGNLLSPSATRYVTNKGATIFWLPWPQLQNPDRAQLVGWLSAVANRFYVLNGGPTQIVTLPTEDVVLGARVLNASTSLALGSLKWSISDVSGTVVAQHTTNLGIIPGGTYNLPTVNVGKLPTGDYTVSTSLVMANQEVDRVDSKLRVFDPTVTYQPDQRIVVASGVYSTVAGRQVFLQGVNYWPRYTVALETGRFNQAWLEPQNYDPDIIEADLTLLSSLNFNMVSILYQASSEARSLLDFLDRCRRHGIWADLGVPAFGGAPALLLYHGQLAGFNPTVASILQAAFLSGNDRVFQYNFLGEPYLGLHNDRMSIDSSWRAWITEQYGSGANAENAWGFTAPRDALGQISNPLDSQVQNDGSWRVMVAAYRRFIDDFLSRAFGAVARQIRNASPGPLLSYRNGGSAALNPDSTLMGEGLTMMQQMNYDFGTAAAHFDVVSPHAYFIPIPWPDGRGFGVETAYARYRSGGKPVLWSEYGINVGALGLGVAAQGTICDSVMRLANEDGSGGAEVWWMPGGVRPDDGSDFGILNPDGSPRPCATSLSQWGAAFQTAPPTQPSGNPVKLTVDRDADARGDVGVFLHTQQSYVAARQAGNPVVLVDAGTGTDTSTMPVVQVGNVTYSGSGPLKYANGEFAGIHVQCPNLDVRVENGAQISVPAGSTCQLTLTLVNTGAATWLPYSQGKGGIILHTSAGDLPLQNTLGFLQRTDFGPLQVTAGSDEVDVTGRLNIQGTGPFGETLQLSLVTGAKSSTNISLLSGGASSSLTLGTSANVQSGFATVSVKIGYAPYGTAVFSFKQNGVTVSEAGVPSSPPTTSARIFIDYRSAVSAIPGRAAAGTIDVNTGLAVVNCGSATANITFTLRDTNGVLLSTGHGTIQAGAHFAAFIDGLQNLAPDFNLPARFATTTQFGSLDIVSDQPLSIVALRGTANQRSEFLITTTPVADLTQSSAVTPVYFPQFVDGGGYVTALVLLNTSAQTETGTLQTFGDKGAQMVVNQAGGSSGSSFRYSIPPGGVYRFQSDGSPTNTAAGWAQLIPDAGSSSPVGAGIFSYNPADVLVTESGVPAAAPTSHARIYVDLSGNLDTGLAIVNPQSTPASVTIKAFQSDGLNGAGTSPGPLQLSADGHSAQFADQFVTGLPAGFKGVLDISSATPFVALALRSRVNERGDFLLTTFPIADQNQITNSSIIFPQIADGGGYITQFILLSAGGESSTILKLLNNSGTPWTVGK